jgi:DNA topoisomerase I
VQAGRYGPYVQSGKIRATLPKELDKDAITLEDAIALIEAKAGKAEKPKAAAKKAPAKKAAAKKTKAKKTTTKKPAAKAEAPQAE